MTNYDVLDFYVAAGAAFEEAKRVIAWAAGIALDEFVDGEDLDALIQAIERAKTGWASCWRTGSPGYPHRFEVCRIDGGASIDAVPAVARALGVCVVVQDNAAIDPYAGLCFHPDGTRRAFSLLDLGDWD